MSLPVQIRQNWISEDPEYSIRRQCRLAGISRNSFYYEPMVESEENLHLMRLIDERYLNRPDYGSPRMTDWLQEQGYAVNRKRVARLMRQMGLEGAVKLGFKKELDNQVALPCNEPLRFSCGLQRPPFSFANAEKRHRQPSHRGLEKLCFP